MHPALQFGYLFLAIPIDTFTGLSLDGASHELFPAYLSLHRTWGPSLIQDLHIGGVIMWVGGDTLMLWPMIPVALRWLHQEERRAVRADRAADAMLLGLDSPAGPSAPIAPSPLVAADATARSTIEGPGGAAR
jgi:putative copper resistance protein D